MRLWNNAQQKWRQRQTELYSIRGYLGSARSRAATFKLRMIGARNMRAAA